MKRNLIRLAPCLEAEPPNGGSITSTFTAPYVYSVIVAYELRRPSGTLLIALPLDLQAAQEVCQWRSVPIFCETGSSDAALGAEQFIYRVGTSCFAPLICGCGQ